MTAAPPRVLVISAHAADFVWRCGGYVAATVAAGGRAEAFERVFPQVAEVLA